MFFVGSSGRCSFTAPARYVENECVCLIFCRSAYQARFCFARPEAELAACKTLAHPQIASARDIRPRPPCTLGYASLSALSPGLTTKLQSRTAHALCCVSGVLAPPLAPKTSHRRKAINGVFYGGYRKLQFVLSLQETYWNIEDSSAKNAAPSEVAQDLRGRARHGERHEALHEVARGTAH